MIGGDEVVALILGNGLDVLVPSICSTMFKLKESFAAMLVNAPFEDCVVLGVESSHCAVALYLGKCWRRRPARRTNGAQSDEA